MKIGLYVNTNKVGLQFGTEKDRDTFWTAMAIRGSTGGADEAAEKFGQRSIRLHPEHFKARLMWEMDIDNLSPQVVSPVSEIKVPAASITAPANLEPVAILKEPEPASVPQPAPPAPVSVKPVEAMAEVGTVTAPAPEKLDLEPIDKRTKLWKDWAKRNKK